MSVQVAAARVDELIFAAAGVLGVPLVAGLRSTMECDDPSDHGPRGRMTVEHRYAITTDTPDSVLDGLVAHWTAQGYRFLRDERGHPLAEIAVETQDGYALIVTTNVLGQLFLLGSSPCVWPSPDVG